MRFQNIFILLLITCSSTQRVYSQSVRIDIFGSPTQQEFDLKTLESEPDAPGVILYEAGNYYAVSIVRRTAVRLVKEIHRKIKVIDAKKFDYSTIEIPYYDGNFYEEEILNYKAVTHNGPLKNYVPESGFYKSKESNLGSALKFTFPNVQDGSILEYKYTIVSPFFYDLDGWEFQHELPTVYSLFQTVLPDNFKYNKILYGSKKLDIQNSFTKKKDFLVPANYGSLDTEVNLFAMMDIPSFTEEEYMLSRKNYISRIVYEPVEFKAFHGFKQIFTRTWKDVDERFKSRSDFGEQLSQKNYFKRKLPKAILEIEGDLERAKAVYNFIQNNYTWNGRYFNYGMDVRDAFKTKMGSVSAINISLVNALEAAKLKAKSVILSTRNNGLPTELYPVLSNFNYVVAVLMIDNQKILLDATDQHAPFGIIPIRALNVKARVLDFENGSYWMPIEPFKQNVYYTNSQIIAESSGKFNGKVSQTSYGYIGLRKRNSIDKQTLVAYINNQESNKAGIEIEDFHVEDLNNIENPLKESYNISIEPEIVNDKVILYPFFNDLYLSENPFKMKERKYPMDFGFPFTNTYLISIDLGDVYKIEHLPKSRSIKLPNDDGECSVTYVSENNSITIRFNMKLNQYHFPPDAYRPLKEFFGTLITMLKDESIILKRI